MTDEPRNSKVHILPIGFLSILFICITMLYGRPVIQNDGISYYALTLSLLEDGDFNLENQYRKHREVRVLHREGRIASYYSAGIALLYYPFLYTMDLFQGLREWKPYAQNVRFPFSHGFGFLIGSAIYSFFSVVFAYFMLFRHQRLSPWSALFIALLCFVGTPLMFYALTVPSFTHSSDTFLITAAFLLTISKNPFSVGFIRMRNVLLGLVLSLSVLLRNNNIVIVPILVLGLNYLEKEQGWKNVIRTWIEIFSGAIPILIVHVYFNFAQYGKLFATGYGVDVSRHVKNRAFRFFWIFFHPVPGIYPWSPIALLGTIGLFLGAFRKRREAIIALAVVAVVIVSIRFAAIIFPGGTFGQRLLTHLYIFWVFGLSELFLRFKKATSVVAVLCVIWTFLLFNTYYILTGTRQSKIMIREGGSTPVEWIRTSWEEYEQARAENRTTSLTRFWDDNLGAKPYPTLIHALRQNGT
jgi:hypothetical protein